MKLLSIINARAMWIFPLADLNPRGKQERNTLHELGRRYSFATTPTPVDIVTAREKNLPLRFLAGTFNSPKKGALGIDLLIYRDGLVADTRSSTSDSADFIDDLLTWSSKEYGYLPHASLTIRKMAVSELHVSTTRALNLINPKLAAFGKAIGSKVPGVPDAVFEVGALGFWSDPGAHLKPIPFRLERADGVPFAENRYFSIAPMETDDHFDLLEKLEAALA